jgi:ABC-2 type transport system permease protein
MILPLIENEVLKVFRRRRFAIVIGIMVGLLSIVAYSQQRTLERRRNRDWHVDVQQRIASAQNYIRRARSDEAWVRSLRAEVSRLQFYLDHDIDPEKPTAPFFTRTFANAGGWFLPLLIAVIASDIVSAEAAEGTDKLLLTRGRRRWKVLLSKLMTLYIFTTLTLLSGALLAYLIASLVLEPRGWDAPTFTGFQIGSERLDFAAVRQLPLWMDALIAYGLQWGALLSVASISLLLSVLFRSSAAAIGTMLASLIGGTILTRISPDWTAAKYLFVSALPLADFYSGAAPPYEGMSIVFCVTMLAIWAVAAVALSFVIFTRRDVFG